MKRGKFSLSHTKLLSCNMGNLIPCGLTEVLPGDSIQQTTSALVRCSPLLAPVMHPVEVRIHHWFVPHRLVWDDWEDFITGGPDGMDDAEFPTMTAPEGGYAVGTLMDYLGVPPGVGDVEHSALPVRGYQLIFNEWYRDQDLVAEGVVDVGSGPDTTTATGIRQVAWEKDMFTSARPWEQKGPSITVPLGSRAPVYGIGPLATSTPNAGTATVVGPVGGPATQFFEDNYNSTNHPLYVNPDGSGTGARANIYADLTGVSAVTVNVLREAMALQRYEEARARYGSRYIEYLRYLGVRSSDARLQRPEYLGGGKQVIQFSEVVQTAEGTDPVGELRGHGISAARSNRYRRFFEEHGYVFSLLSVRPKTIYAQGLPRTWNRRTKEDFWQQELQHIGQQEVLNKEVYAANPSPDGTFGYQDRYDEYRRSESSIAGEFRTSLDFWHLARIFASPPALNESFVQAVPTERIFAVPSQDVLYVYARHSIQARRLVAQTGRSYIF